MKPYETYTAEDFACDNDFFTWVKYPGRYPHLESFWAQWLLEYPEKREIIDEARCLVQAVLADDNYFPHSAKERDVWARIQTTTGLSGRTIPLWQRWYAYAAVVVLCLAIAWFNFRDELPKAEAVSQNTELPFIRHVNNADAPQTIVLGDGTSIILKPHGVLEYPKTFADDLREVSLTGEAFFEVKRDAARPFLVRSGGIITRVLGTSFTVRNVEGEENVLVQVKTGKVSVFKATERSRPSEVSDNNVEGVVLMPNQQVVFEKSAMKMTKSLVENPAVVTPPRRRNFEFVDTPIGEVFRSIEEAYGVQIVFDEEILASCYLNASLDDVPLYDKLKLICKGINASYEIIDSHIIIYGTGCREEIDEETDNPKPQ